MKDQKRPAFGVAWNLLDRYDYWRRSSAPLSAPSGHKEWSYFCVFDERLTLIANLNIMDRPPLGGNVHRPTEEARVAVLVRNLGGRWHGEIVACAPETVSIPAGGINARFGRSTLAFVDGGYRLHTCGDLLEANLQLRPEARPALTRSIPLGRMEPMHWLVVPRLSASGEVRIGNERHYLSNCPAYHDHNWGRFAWGGNFGWEWGISLTGGDDNSWSLIYYRITDRGRHEVMSQGLLLWRREHHSRTFQDRELGVRSVGLLRACRPLRVPGVTALAIPGTASDIPRRIEVIAKSGEASIEVSFELDDYAQIAVPNDNDAGFTSISETHGRARATGCIRGERINFQSPAVMEFNRAA